MTDLSNKRVCFVDNGIFPSFARKIAPAFGKAYYAPPWAGSFPKSAQLRLGEGFPEFEVVRYPLLIADKIDLWVFMDTFYGGLSTFLSERGARVWGAKMGEEIELERAEFKMWCKKNGVQTPPGTLIEGMDKLREYLEPKENQWIKLASGYHRGDMETWKWKNKHVSTPRLDQLEYDFGAFKDTTKFIVEEPIEDSIEIGEDTFTIDGEFPKVCMFADEIKGLGMVGTVKQYEEMPEALRQSNDKLKPLFKGYEYRGFWCLEGLINKSREFYLTDPCTRLGSPSNELLQEMFTGWPETIWEGADGNLVDPKPAAKYGCVAMVYSEQSGRNWQPLSYPKEIDQWVKLRNPYALGGKRYAVPQGEPTNLAGVVGVGGTLLEAARACAGHVSQLDGHLIEISLDAIDKALDVIDQGEEFGVKFSAEPLPSAEELREAVNVS